MSVTYFQYIDRYKTKDAENSTNYRMPDPNLKIYGGTFHVPDLDYAGFLNRYCREVLEPGYTEYLTETQLKSGGGPILVDLDFRFPYETTDRQYTKDDLNALVESYAEELAKIFDFNESSLYNIYVLEKTKVNRVKDKNLTKDGIHIIIGISAEREMQIILREKMLKKLPNVLPKLPIINKWDDVLDKGISKGGTSWQLYGSTKPDCEPYRLTHIFTVGYDPNDGQPSCDGRSVNDTDWAPKWSALIHQLSARCRTHPIFTYRREYLQESQKIEPVRRVTD